MFGNGSLLTANTAWCKSLGLGKLVCCLASSWVKEGSSSTSGKVWSKGRFLFGTGKSIFQECIDFASRQSFWELVHFKFILFIFSFFIIPTFILKQNNFSWYVLFILFINVVTRRISKNAGDKMILFTVNRDLELTVSPAGYMSSGECFGMIGGRGDILV